MILTGNKNQGLFITLEGCDGAGKSTQVNRIKTFLDANEIDCIITREPGGTQIGEKIRRLILDPDSQIMLRTEVLLYAAARAELVQTVILPAMNECKVVVCERYVDSSIVYQGIAGGCDINEIWSINGFAIQNVMPDITFLLDIDPLISLTQRSLRGDRIERRSNEYHLKVRQGFLRLATLDPERFFVIDAVASVDVVWSNIREVLYNTLISRGIMLKQDLGGR